MEKNGKEDLIIIRIQKSRKEILEKGSVRKANSLISLIIHSVENRIPLNDERRNVMAFIENRTTFLLKIETNINQISKNRKMDKKFI